MKQGGKLEGWKVEKLTDVFELRPPKKEARDLLSENDFVSFLPMEDLDVFQRDVVAVKEKTLKEVSASYTYFANNDVLLAKITPCFENGKAGIARYLKNGIGFGSSEYMVFRSKGNVIPEFLFYFFALDEFRKEGEKAMTGAAGQKRVSPKFIESLDFAYPPLPEQQRIVSVLDEAFASIAQAKSNAERNLVNARELYKSLMHEVFENKDWEEKKFGDVCGFVRGPFGGSLKKEIFVKDGYAVYEQQHAIYDQFDEIRYFINRSKFDEMQRFEINPGNLIMSCSGTMGKVAIVPEGIKQGIINQALLLLKPNKHLLNTFIKYWMESENFQESLRAFSQGAAIQNVASVKILKEISVPVPPLAEQRAIVGRLEALSAETGRLGEIYQQKVESLEELKKSVLQRAFAGEL